MHLVQLAYTGQILCGDFWLCCLFSLAKLCFRDAFAPLLWSLWDFSASFFLGVSSMLSRTFI